MIRVRWVIVCLAAGSCLNFDHVEFRMDRVAWLLLDFQLEPKLMAIPNATMMIIMMMISGMMYRRRWMKVLSSDGACVLHFAKKQLEVSSFWYYRSKQLTAEMKQPQSSR